MPKFAKKQSGGTREHSRKVVLFFKYVEDTIDEDLRNIAERSPIIKLACDELDKFRCNEKDLLAYEERIMDLRKAEGILAQKLDDATEKGRQEGIQIGEERGIKIGAEKGGIEVAKNLLKAGISIDIIAQTTGLSEAEIVQLKEKVTS